MSGICGAHYPMPAEEQGVTDSRFTFGLAADVAKVLTDHGYPEVDPVEHVRLISYLYRFLYVDEDADAEEDED